MSAPAPATHKVFICYRREDTSAYAGRLYDAMVSRFGEGNVFMDVELAPGVDFEERITEVVSGCLALIVVMGPRWATVQGEDGGRRLDDPADFVRLEVETGLGRSDVTPIPVLVGGARMPRREDLPEPLRPLARRNAQEMSDRRWAYDLGRLFDALDDLLPGSERAGTNFAAVAPPTPEPSPPPAPEPVAPHERRLIFEGMLIGGATAFAARLLASVFGNPGPAGLEESSSEVAEHVLSVVLRRMETWAIVGAVLAIWLVLRLGRRDGPVRQGLRGLLIGAIAGALGGAIWALAAYLPDPNASATVRSWVEVPALALTAGMIGWLLGSLWPRRRSAVGFVCGAATGAMYQVLTILVRWDHIGDRAAALSFALVAAAVAGLTLATMLALDRGESRSTVGAEARAP